MFGLLLLDEVPLTKMKSVLDVGCGTGFPLIELAERLGARSHVHGIDPWSGALARAADKIAARGTPNVTLHEGSANALPFPDGTFDLIVSNLGVNNFDDRDDAGRRRLREHVQHRASVASVRDLLKNAGFRIVRVVEREGFMRFADGAALLNHHFIKLGFLDAWKKVVPGNERAIFSELLRRMDGELRLTIPMAYVEAEAR